MQVKLIHCTPEAEKHIAYCARVSSPKQDNPDYAGLIKYCIKHKHWSILEMASMCVEIKTSRAISAQLIRHKSINFQELSQRYAEVNTFEINKARRQDTKNRQNSIDDMSEEDQQWFLNAQLSLQKASLELYNTALEKGIAKEQARFLLPMSTQTKMYAHGTLRNWIHYLQVRCDESTQLEHREVANEIKKIFVKEFPVVAKALEWS